MPTRVPVPSPLQLAALVPPCDWYPFFRLDDRPFEAGAMGFSGVNACWLAEASLLAYSANAAQRMPDGWACEPFGDPAASTQGFAMHNSSACIVALRGTELRFPQVLHDVGVDLRAVARFVAAGEQAAAHSGFLDAAFPVRAEIARIVDSQRGKAIWFTGHSLGGALAVIAAAEHPGTRGVVTFGMPRVGNAAYAAFTQLGGRLFRVVHAEDPVAELPPRWPWVTPVAGSSYVHFGTRIDLSASGDLRQQGPADPGSAVNNALAPLLLADHAPIYYAALLHNRLC